MNLRIERKYFKDTYSIGTLSIDGVYFCDTLEDRYRAMPEEKKIYGQTAISPGTYRIIMSYSNRFKRIMPEVLNVPYFEGIRIHSGNTDADTSGCILVGKNTIKGQLIDSRTTSDKLNIILNNTNEKVYLGIENIT